MSSNNNTTSNNISYTNSSNVGLNSYSYTQNQSMENSFIKNYNEFDSKVQKKEQIKNILTSKEKGIIFICKKCWSVPSLDKIEDFSLDISCDHSVLKDILPSEFLDKYLFMNIEDQLGNINITKDLKCGKHSEQYAYYDTDCDINLCCECVASVNDHKSDTKINLDDAYIISKKQSIEKKLMEIDKITEEILSNKKEERQNELLDLYKIIKIILSSYEDYPVYKHYENIENIYNYFEQKEVGKELFKIRNKDELNKYIFEYGQANKILSINLSEQAFNSDENVFINLKGKINLSNLKELDLSKNKLKNIKFLFKIEMPKLVILNLSVNDLGDKLIEDIDQLICPELISLNLYKVHLENYFIFDKMKHFPKLKLLYIGLNKFSKEKSPGLTEETEFDLSSIRNIGLSKIWSTKDGVKDLKYFRFKNLNEIYLSGNNISSIDDIELNCNEIGDDNTDYIRPLLKIFWLSNNNLEKFASLEHYKFLKDLAIDNNQIKDISNLDSFLSQFKYLKKFNIEKNQIKYAQNKDNKDIIDKVVKKYKNMKIEY